MANVKHYGRGRIKGSVEGLEFVQKGMRKNQQKFLQAQAVATFEEGIRVMKDSQLKVPVLTGYLRSTGRVDPPVRLREPIVSLKYTAHYAAMRHEVPMRKSKFLERSIVKFEPNAADRIASGIRRHLRLKRPVLLKDLEPWISPHKVDISLAKGPKSVMVYAHQL